MAGQTVDERRATKVVGTAEDFTRAMALLERLDALDADIAETRRELRQAVKAFAQAAQQAVVEAP